jgi:hypothetical protein
MLPLLEIIEPNLSKGKYIQSTKTNFNLKFLLKYNYFPRGKYVYCE